MGELLLIAFISSGPQYGGIYCDEVAMELIRYNEETGAFSEEVLEELTGRCEVWEEVYEEGIESGELKPINNEKVTL